jgi:hypothetical protein
MSAQPMFEPEDDEAGEHWLSVGDMMAGLMVIFLFIALTYMHNVIEDRDRIHEIAITYEKRKNQGSHLSAPLRRVQGRLEKMERGTR